MVQERLGILVVACMLAGVVCDHSKGAQSAEIERPNFVIIFCDDLGYGDLGCYGHPTIRTPRLDQMALEGLRFTDFYSTAEVCTPSRAALLTGRYPLRSGMCSDKQRVLRANAAGGLPAEEITLAEILKERGYATACIGKWHLGVQPEFGARKQGFDYFFGLPHSNDMNPSSLAPRGAPARLDQSADWWNAPLFRNEDIIERPADQTTLTQRYTDEAIQFIRQHKSEPFFVYLPHSMPHVPLFRSKDFVEKSSRGLYGDVIEEIDASAGRILDVLQEQGIDEKTMVVFTSDNGPWLTQGLAGGSAGLLRDGKGSTYDGGMRVPCIVRWPKQIDAAQISSGLACTMDLFTTMTSLAGAKVPQDRAIDGLDLSPLLFSRSPSPRESFGFYRGTQLFALRKGPFKAHFITRAAYGPDDTQLRDPPLLFRLDHDPGESFNIAAHHPEVVADLIAEASRLKQGIDPAPSQLESLLSETP